MVSGVILAAITIALWFVPMLIATGGAARYFAANSELWEYNNEPMTIWYAPLSSRIDTLLTLIGVLSYASVLGTILLLFAAYCLFRSTGWRNISRDKLLFFFTWLIPPMAFFIVVFIPPYKYPYGLVLLPAFWVMDAIRAAQAPHHFLSVTKAGHSAIVSTSGNEDCHIILRGGKQPNYDTANVDTAAKNLAQAGIPARIMIDCSHGNSGKDPAAQVKVGNDVATQIAAGDERIFGIMIESHLKAGRQDLLPGKPLVYGQSITDACVGWEETRGLIDALASAVRQRRLRAAANGDSD